MSIEETLTERETRYGSYKNNAMTTQLLKSVVQEHTNYYDMSNSAWIVASALRWRHHD